MERRPHTRGIAVKVQKPKKKPVWQCSDSSASETELDHEVRNSGLLVFFSAISFLVKSSWILRIACARDEGKADSGTIPRKKGLANKDRQILCDRVARILLVSSKTLLPASGKPKIRQHKTSTQEPAGKASSSHGPTPQARGVHGRGRCFHIKGSEGLSWRGAYLLILFGPLE